jgi:hypothetical protein
MHSSGYARARTKFMRRFLSAAWLSCVMMPLQCATLERLSLDDMILKSTSIVRGTVLDSAGAYSGPVIYTHYRVHVSECFKGCGSTVVDVAVPGGAALTIRQTFAGAPQLQPGAEFVFFLWTSKAGLTQIIGLTQGMFVVSSGDGAATTVRRSASHELMLDRTTHQPVKDQPLAMALSDLRAQIAATLGAGK